MCSLFGCVEALRESSIALVLGLTRWLPTVVEWEDWQLPQGEQRLLWSTFGVSGELLDALLELQLRFADGRLRVATAMKNRDDCAQMIMVALTSLWRFRAWTDSRWASMGPTSHRMVLAFLAGMDDLIAFLQHNKMISEYYINAYVANNSGKHRRCFIVGAVASHLADAALHAILQDNRAPLRLPAIDNAMNDKVNWAVGISTSVWAVLADICNATIDDLRSECISVTLASLGFIEMRLREARRLPWGLVGPNMGETLQNLKRGEKPTERTAAKIWQLLHMDIFDGVCESGVKLLGEAPWSSAMVEEGHASATMMLRHHQYDDQALRLRSTMMQARC